MNDEEKEQFLILKKWDKLKGFLVNTPPASEDSDWTFVSSEDMLESIKKGEQVFFSQDTFDGRIHTLEEAFEYAYDDFFEEEQERLDSDELTDEQITKNIKALLELDNLIKKLNEEE